MDSGCCFVNPAFPSPFPVARAACEFRLVPATSRARPAQDAQGHRWSTMALQRSATYLVTVITTLS